jgi:hypothetical protein
VKLIFTGSYDVNSAFWEWRRFEFFVSTSCLARLCVAVAQALWPGGMGLA